MAHQWRGVIREYADRLPMLDGAPVVTLHEGGTPLIHAEKLSALRRRRGATSSTKVSTRPARSRTAA